MPTSGMPSRSRLLSMAGDPRITTFAQMSRTRKAQMIGDPFLGGIIRAIGSGIGILGRKVLVPALKSQLGIVSPIPPIVQDPRAAVPGIPPVGAIVKSGISRIVIPSPLGSGFPVPRRRRRMNPLNPRALRRALSRASAFARFARRALHVTFGKAPKVRFKLRRKKAT